MASSDSASASTPSAPTAASASIPSASAFFDRDMKKTFGALLEQILTKYYTSTGKDTRDVSGRMKQYLNMEVPREYIDKQREEYPDVVDTETRFALMSIRRESLIKKLKSLGDPQIIYERKRVKQELIKSINDKTREARGISFGGSSTKDIIETNTSIKDIIETNNTYWWDFVYHLLTTTILRAEKTEDVDPEIPDDLGPFMRELKIYTGIELVRGDNPDGSFSQVKEAMDVDFTSPVFTTIDFVDIENNKLLLTPLKEGQYEIVKTIRREKAIMDKRTAATRRKALFSSPSASPPSPPPTSTSKFCPAHVLHYGELVHLDHPSLRCTCERSYPV